MQEHNDLDEKLFQAAVRVAAQHMEMAFDKPLDPARVREIEEALRPGSTMRKMAESLLSYLNGTDSVPEKVSVALDDLRKTTERFAKEAGESGIGLRGGKFSAQKYIARHKRFWGLVKSAALEDSYEEDPNQVLKLRKFADALVKLLADLERNYKEGLDQLGGLVEESKTAGPAAVYPEKDAASFLNGFQHLFYDYLLESKGVRDSLTAAIDAAGLGRGAEVGSNAMGLSAPEEKGVAQQSEAMIGKIRTSIDAAFAELRRRHGDQALADNAAQLMKGLWAETASVLETVGFYSSGKFDIGKFRAWATGKGLKDLPQLPDPNKALVEGAKGTDGTVDEFYNSVHKHLDSLGEAISELQGDKGTQQKALYVFLGSLSPVMAHLKRMTQESKGIEGGKPTGQQATVDIPTTNKTVLLEDKSIDRAPDDISSAKHEQDKAEIEKLIGSLFGGDNHLVGALAEAEQVADGIGEAARMDGLSSLWLQRMHDRLSKAGLRPDGTFQAPAEVPDTSKMTKFAFVKKEEATAALTSAKAKEFVSALYSYVDAYRHAMADTGTSEEMKHAVAWIFRMTLTRVRNSIVAFNEHVNAKALKSKEGKPDASQVGEVLEDKPGEQAQAVSSPQEQQRKKGLPELKEVGIPSDEDEIADANQPVSSATAPSGTIAKHLRQTMLALPNSTKASGTSKVEEFNESIPNFFSNPAIAAAVADIESKYDALDAKYKEKDDVEGGKTSIADRIIRGDSQEWRDAISEIQRTIGAGVKAKKSMPDKVWDKVWSALGAADSIQQSVKALAAAGSVLTNGEMGKAQKKEEARRSNHGIKDQVSQQAAATRLTEALVAVLDKYLDVAPLKMSNEVPEAVKVMASMRGVRNFLRDAITNNSLPLGKWKAEHNVAAGATINALDEQVGSGKLHGKQRTADGVSRVSKLFNDLLAKSSDKEVELKVLPGVVMAAVQEQQSASDKSTQSTDPFSVYKKVNHLLNKVVSGSSSMLARSKAGLAQLSDSVRADAIMLASLRPLADKVQQAGKNFVSGSTTPPEVDTKELSAAEVALSINPPGNEIDSSNIALWKDKMLSLLNVDGKKYSIKAFPGVSAEIEAPKEEKGNDSSGAKKYNLFTEQDKAKMKDAFNGKKAMDLDDNELTQAISEIAPVLYGRLSSMPDGYPVSFGESIAKIKDVKENAGQLLIGKKGVRVRARELLIRIQKFIQDGDEKEFMIPKGKDRKDLKSLLLKSGDFKATKPAGQTQANPPKPPTHPIAGAALEQRLVESSLNMLSDNTKFGLHGLVQKWAPLLNFVTACGNPSDLANLGSSIVVLLKEVSGADLDIGDDKEAILTLAAKIMDTATSLKSKYKSKDEAMAVFSAAFKELVPELVTKTAHDLYSHLSGTDIGRVIATYYSSLHS